MAHKVRGPLGAVGDEGRGVLQQRRVPLQDAVELLRLQDLAELAGERRFTCNPFFARYLEAKRAAR